MPRLKKLFFAFFYKINYSHILFHYIIVFFHFTNCHPIIVSGVNRKVVFIHYFGIFLNSTSYSLWLYTLFSLWLTEYFSCTLDDIYLHLISFLGIHKSFDKLLMIKASLSLSAVFKLGNSLQSHLSS